MHPRKLEHENVNRHLILDWMCVIKPAWAIAIEIDCLATSGAAGLAVM